MTLLSLVPLAALAALVSACGDEPTIVTTSSAPANGGGATTAGASADSFVAQVRALCADTDERAYRRVQEVFPPGATGTPKRLADEARIRAEATEELVDGLDGLTPTAEFANRWSGVVAGLREYGNYERAREAAIKDGSGEPERPDGLDGFRLLGLGGKCNDWLDMN